MKTKECEREVHPNPSAVKPKSGIIGRINAPFYSVLGCDSSGTGCTDNRSPRKNKMKFVFSVLIEN